MARTFMKGNEAIAESAVRAGCRFFAGYPITPQNDIPEYLSRRLPEVGGVFVQGESEIASINMVLGAAATGTRALTSSSSPGVSLKTEGISTMAGAQLPSVIINVTRGGPGLGSIQAAQMDYLQATRAMGHGGFKMLVYAPASVQEAADLTCKAFDKSMEYQAPMLISIDGCIGSMMEPVELPEMRDAQRADLRFASSNFVQSKRKIITSMMSLEEQQEQFNRQMAEMYEKWKAEEGMVEEYLVEDAEIIIAAYGVSSRISRAAITTLRENGVRVGMIRPITIWPFPYDSFERLDYTRVRHILSVEHSIPPQMVEDLHIGVAKRASISAVTHSGGIIFTMEEIVDAVSSIVQQL